MPSESSLIQSTNAKLFTTIYTKQNCETLILLHGGPGVPMDYSPIITHLCHKFQVIIFDQRGTGRSPTSAATYAIQEYLDDINNIAKHFNIKRFHLFGHSWGGLYAQIYAEKYPENILSMFLSSPSSGTGRIWEQTEREVMEFNKNHSGFLSWSMMGIKSLFGMLGFDTAYQSLFKQVLENYNKDYDPAFIATDAMVENIRSEPINKTRSQLVKYPLLKTPTDYTFPVIIVYGNNDIYGDSKRYVMKRFPKAIFVEIQNSGHIPWKHNKNAFNNTLSKFYKMNN